MTDWNAVSRRMEHLIASDAPSFIKAHWLMNVGFPVLMRSVGVRDCGQELAAMMTKFMCEKSGLCVCCRKHDSVSADETMCPACVASMDQMVAEIMQDDENDLPE